MRLRKAYKCKRAEHSLIAVLWSFSSPMNHHSSSITVPIVAPATSTRIFLNCATRPRQLPHAPSIFLKIDSIPSLFFAYPSFHAVHHFRRHGAHVATVRSQSWGGHSLNVKCKRASSTTLHLSTSNGVVDHKMQHR